MKIFFNDSTFSSQLLRTLGSAYYKCADIGECLSTAYRVKEGDFESWHSEWFKTAERVRKYASESLSKGHFTSAREAFLRSSNYYRSSEFMLIDPSDKRILTTSQLSKECFRQAISLFPFSVDRLQIPYENTTIPGYFFHLRNSNKSENKGYFKEKNENEMINQDKFDHLIYKEDTSLPSTSNLRPTLIVHGGFDSTIEELYSFAAAPALERGYNCLTFEGPGQGEVIRTQNIPFRHDWENVVTPVIDYLLERKEQYNIDPKKIALMGISMGGYLAARAASFEPRLTACILYNGVYDGFDSIQSGFPEDLSKAVNGGNADYVNDFLNELMKSDTNIRFNMMHGMWVAGAKSPFELILGAKKYTVKDLLPNIKCPTLVLEAEKDDSFPGQPKKVYDGLSSLTPKQKKYIVFTELEGAEEHCQSGAASLTNQRIFDWLDEMYDNNINSKVEGD